MERNRITEYLSSIGVEDSESKGALLEKYTDEIMLFNPSLKLVGSKERDEIITRHILDCAAAYSVFYRETKDGESIADLGSGAGLPGIVLGVLFPSRRFFLIERMQRRVGFLRSVKAVLKLDNVTVVDRDIKDAGLQFDALTSRAFHPVCDIASDAVKLSSKALFYKGTEKNILSETASLRDSGYTFDEEIVPLSVGGLDEERNMLILRNWGKK